MANIFAFFKLTQKFVAHESERGGTMWHPEHRFARALA
jgi:hypothetical protein